MKKKPSKYSHNYCELMMGDGATAEDCHVAVRMLTGPPERLRVYVTAGLKVSPCAGHETTYDTYSACIEYLDMLRTIGLAVPQKVLDDLMDEESANGDSLTPQEVISHLGDFPMGSPVVEQPDAPDCNTCDDTEKVPHMLENDPHGYELPDDEGMVPCPDCVPQKAEMDYAGPHEYTNANALADLNTGMDQIADYASKHPKQTTAYPSLKKFSAKYSDQALAHFTMDEDGNVTPLKNYGFTEKFLTGMSQVQLDTYKALAKTWGQGFSKDPLMGDTHLPNSGPHLHFEEKAASQKPQDIAEVYCTCLLPSQKKHASKSVVHMHKCPAKPILKNLEKEN